MAVSVSHTSSDVGTVVGDLRCTVSHVTFDSSYPTGGEPLTFKQLGLSTVTSTICQIEVPSAEVVTSANYNKSTQKLQAFTSSAEVANTHDLSDLVVKVLAFGK